MKKITPITLVVALFVVPYFAIASGLVPCGGPNETPCQFCHVITLIDNIVDWLVAVLSILVAIIFVVSGIQLATSAGDVSAKESAKKRIINATIGFVIVLTAWLLIDIGMKSLLKTGPNTLGPWNSIQCVVQPVYTNSP